MGLLGIRLAFDCACYDGEPEERVWDGHFIIFSFITPPHPIWHFWPPLSELVCTCPLTATLLSRAATKHNVLLLS